MKRTTIEHGICQFTFAGASWREVLTAWQESESFRDEFSVALSEPFDACFWETPPVSRTTLDRAFECVMVDSPALAALSPDPEPFRRHLSAAGPEGVAVFASLGGDATLISPAGAEHDFGHLVRFLRTAPRAQVHALWRAVGRELARLLSESAAPRWVSTAGLGVHWLHVRLDERPKYYVHRTYR